MYWITATAIQQSCLAAAAAVISQSVPDWKSAATTRVQLSAP